MRFIEYFSLGLSVLTFLGVHLQTLGSKTNTQVRLLDLCMNIGVVLGFLLTFYVRASLPIKVFFGIWAWFCILNVYPLGEMIFSYMTTEIDSRGISDICDRAKTAFHVPVLKSRVPVVYICNHALGSLDDIVAIGALTSEDVTVMINPGPSGLSSIPADCRDRMCVLPSGSGRYDVTKTIIWEEVVGKKKSLIVFGEDMKQKYSSRVPSPLRKGVINICWELNLPMVAVWFDWPTQFPSVFGDPRKVLPAKKSQTIYPRNYPSSEYVQQELFEMMEKLSFS